LWGSHGKIADEKTSTGYLSISSNVLASVTSLCSQFPSFPIFTTGHSLGGALAVLSALALREAGIENVNVVTFGQPRLGNHYFVSYISQTITADPSSSPFLFTGLYRVVNTNDLVPHWPSQILDFTHAPTEIWFPPRPENEDDTLFDSPYDHQK
jgi:hypothetical protein